MPYDRWVNGKLSSLVVQGEVVSVGVSRVWGTEGTEALHLQRSDSASDTQSYLPCKSAFINATFVSKIIGKEKAKQSSC